MNSKNNKRNFNIVKTEIEKCLNTFRDDCKKLGVKELYIKYDIHSKCVFERLLKYFNIVITYEDKCKHKSVATQLMWKNLSSEARSSREFNRIKTRENWTETDIQSNRDACSIAAIKRFKNYSKEDIMRSRLKCHQTQKRNNTCGKSRMEDFFYAYLLNKYGDNDVIRFYSTDVRYPFNCDFYIKSKDMFIELNLMWCHGKEPFDASNPKHLKIKKEWEEKSLNSHFYKEALYTWTIRDVEKNNIAIKNSLNYRRIYIDEFKNKWAYNSKRSVEDFIRINQNNQL